MQEGEEEHYLVCAAAAFNYVVCRVEEEVVCSTVRLADFDAAAPARARGPLRAAAFCLGVHCPAWAGSPTRMVEAARKRAAWQMGSVLYYRP